MAQEELEIINCGVHSPELGKATCHVPGSRLPASELPTLPPPSLLVPGLQSPARESPLSSVSPGPLPLIWPCPDFTPRLTLGRAESRDPGRSPNWAGRLLCEQRGSGPSLGRSPLQTQPQAQLSESFLSSAWGRGAQLGRGVYYSEVLLWLSHREVIALIAGEFRTSHLFSWGLIKSLATVVVDFQHTLKGA